MTPEQLKASILQYAIQGKLVEQRPEEGTGEELYQQIQAEKQRLIQEKKIKKEKTLAEVSEDEIPFDIPESWKWARFSSVIELQSGQDMTPDKYNADHVGIPYITGASNITNGDVLINRWTECGKAFAYKGDVLFTCKGTVGTMAVLQEAKVHIARQIMAIRPIGSISVYYIQVVLDTLVSSLKAAAKSIIPGIAREDILTSLIPLLPLAEQKRIVAKIEKLFPLVDRYAVAYEKLEQFNAKFPEDMKKSILQYAIQGKLVEQRPEEGTGEELYQQIQAEKQRLIQEKKIKKEKPLVEISEDEIPFDIPESWKWVRLSQIATLENGDRSSKYPVESDYVDFGVPFFGAKDMDGAIMSFENVRYISETKFSELRNGKLQDKDFICLLRGSVGKCAIFVADERHHTGFICAQMVIIRCADVAVSDYLKVYLSSPYYLKYIDSKVTGTAVRQLPAKELSNVLIPLPPLAEQKRIVAKIEQMLPLCERLK